MREVEEDRVKNRATSESEWCMETPNKANPEFKPAAAEAHIRSAHEILKALQEKIGEHPEIGAAITEVEMALNVLAVKTAGIL